MIPRISIPPFPSIRAHAEKIFGGDRPVFHGVDRDKPAMTDNVSSPAALLTGRYTTLPVTVAVGLLMITPVFGSSPVWPSLAGIILAAAFALPFGCR